MLRQNGRSGRSGRTQESLRRLSETLPERTPDGRYIIVRGRLWRATNPNLSDDRREKLVKQLMDARRAVGAGLRADDKDAEEAARAKVHAAKVALGERGPVWWDDGEPDQNRKMVRNSTYADWWASVSGGSED
jgi:hypothetical protein